MGNMIRPRLMGLATIGAASLFLAGPAMAQTPAPQIRVCALGYAASLRAPKIRHDTPDERRAMIRLWQQDLDRNPSRKSPASGRAKN